jgi:hypothetical protein
LKQKKEGEGLTVIADFVFVEDAALALMGGVSDPDAADTEVIGFGADVDFIPQCLIEFLFQR